jgi:hypothetical protein
MIVAPHPAPSHSKVEKKQAGGAMGWGPNEFEETGLEGDDEPDDDLEEEEVPGSPEEEDNRRIVIEAAKALRGESQNPEEALNEFLEVYGKQKLEELKAFVAEEEAEPEEPAYGMAEGGRLVEGPGRGLDDRIAARAGEQPVLLSDGEFVVPADVVSHLGDGSTKAGVRALEAMMARARHAKTGRKKQAAKLDTKKVLPV